MNVEDDDRYTGGYEHENPDVRQGKGDPDLVWNFHKGSWHRPGTFASKRFRKAYERLMARRPKDRPRMGRITFTKYGTLFEEK